jgi:predicted RNase H-like HicB family nuclease
MRPNVIFWPFTGGRSRPFIWADWSSKSNSCRGRGPDRPDCMTDGETTDGETEEEARASVKDAVAAWTNEAKRLGHSVPPPRHLQEAE